MRSKASCSCNTNQYQINGIPLSRFICHCTICQAYTGKPYSDVLAFRAGDIQLSDIRHTDFMRWRKPPNVERGTCSQCGQPSIEFALKRHLVFVPASNVEHPSGLPEIDFHLFYQSRVADIHDGHTKYNSYLSSSTALIRKAMQRW